MLIVMINEDDAEGYKNLLNESREIYDVGFKKLVHRPFNTIFSMISPSTVTFSGVI